MTPAQRITKTMQKELDGKRKFLAAREGQLHLTTDPKKRHALEIEMRRLEKSIANRVGKVLCPHTRVTTTAIKQSPQAHVQYHHCADCKGAASS